MVRIKKAGSEVSFVEVTIDGKKYKLSKNSKPEVLFIAVEELSRVILGNQNNIDKDDFDYYINKAFNSIKGISGSDIISGINKADYLINRLHYIRNCFYQSIGRENDEY